MDVVRVSGTYALPCPLSCALVAPTSGEVSALMCPSHSSIHGNATDPVFTIAVDAVSARIAGVVAMLFVAVEFM